jgi:RND family efflux transporter MFP subunit
MTESPVDLNPLRIERGASDRAPRRRGLPGLGWIVFLVLAGVAAFLFRGPLLRGVDLLRLPKVSITRAQLASRMESSAVQGAAANGYIVARTRAALSADTPGRIVELSVTEGSLVKKGDVVARLFSDEIRAALRRAEAELAAVQAALGTTQARVAEAHSDVSHAIQEVSAAAARQTAAEADLAWSEATLARVQELVGERIQTEQDLLDAQTAQARNRAGVEAARAARAALEAAVAQAEARLRTAEQAVPEAEAHIAAARAGRDAAQATLDKTEVRAPFDGVVVLKDAEVGEVVTPSAFGAGSRGAVVTMVDFASLEAQVELSETSLAAVELGAPATIFLDAYPDRPYAGRVERIWPTANRQKGTIEVRVRFDQPDERLRPELGARVVFAALSAPSTGEDESPRVLVQSSALVAIDGVRGVFVLERDVVRWRALELGEEKGGRVIVRAGLAGGETLVDHPPADLEDGRRVQVRGNPRAKP